MKCGKWRCYATSMQFIFYLPTWDHGLARPTELGINKQYLMANLKCVVTTCTTEIQNEAYAEERLVDTETRRGPTWRVLFWSH